MKELTSMQAAERLGVSVSAIHKWCDAYEHSGGKNGLQCRRLPMSSHRRIPEQALDEFAARWGVPLPNEQQEKGGVSS